MKNVLSIDGGGIKGLYTAYILNEIEKELRIITKNPEDKLANYLDLSVGSSTGAIIVSILNVKDEDGFPMYDSSDIIDMYINDSKNIFKKSLVSKIKSFFGFRRVTYDNKYLKKSLINYLGNMRVEDSYKNLMITSLDLTNSELFLFKSFGSNKGYKLWESVLASAAAPTYFEPIEIIKNEQSICLTDGGIAINNPSISSYIEMRKIDNKHTVNLLSIGTGYVHDPSEYTWVKVRKWGKVKWIPVIANTILSATSKTSDYLTSTLYETEFKGNYLRLNSELKFASEEIDDASMCNLENLKKDAHMMFKDNREEIIKFIRLIVK